MEQATVGSRLRSLRESIGLSQQKLGEKFGGTQAAINRYETSHAEAPYRVLLWYADYFNVSMDYIFGRTDDPNGARYDYQPQKIKAQNIDPEDMKLFMEACLEPGSKMNEKFKEMLLQKASEQSGTKSDKPQKHKK